MTDISSNYNQKIKTYAHINKISDDEARKKLQKEEEAEEQHSVEPGSIGEELSTEVMEQLVQQGLLATVVNGSTERIELDGITLSYKKNMIGSTFNYSLDKNTNTLTLRGKDCIINITEVKNPNIKVILTGSRITLNSQIPVESITNKGSYNVINGSSQKDKITNVGINTTINAGGGDDVINSTGIRATIRGGAGNDTITATGVGTNIFGNQGIDEITATGINIFADGGDNSSLDNENPNQTEKINTTGISIGLDGGNGENIIFGKGIGITAIGSNKKRMARTHFNLNGSNIRIRGASENDSATVNKKEVNIPDIIEEENNSFKLEDGKLYQYNELVAGDMLYENKLYQDGQLSTGYAVYENKLYQNGELTTSDTVYENKLYQNGELATGDIIYQDKLYQNGELATGDVIYQDKLYQNGELATGNVIYQDKLYQNGELATGDIIYQDKLYQNGELATGDVIYQDKLYQNGELATGDIIYQDKLYRNGELPTGDIIYQDKLYRNGVLSTGNVIYQDKLYHNGEIAQGDILHTNNKMYHNGELADKITIQGVYYENGIPYTGTKNSTADNITTATIYKNGLVKSETITEYNDSNEIVSRIITDYESSVTKNQYNFVYKDEKITSFNETLNDDNDKVYSYTDIVWNANIMKEYFRTVNGETLFFYNGMPATGTYHDKVYEKGVLSASGTQALYDRRECAAILAKINITGNPYASNIKHANDNNSDNIISFSYNGKSYNITYKEDSSEITCISEAAASSNKISTVKDYYFEDDIYQGNITTQTNRDYQSTFSTRNNIDAVTITSQNAQNEPIYTITDYRNNIMDNRPTISDITLTSAKINYADGEILTISEGESAVINEKCLIEVTKGDNVTHYNEIPENRTFTLTKGNYKVVVNVEATNIENFDYEFNGGYLYIRNTDNMKLRFTESNANKLYINADGAEITWDNKTNNDIYLVGNNNNIYGTDKTNINGTKVYITGQNNNIQNRQIVNSNGDTFYLSTQYSATDDVRDITITNQNSLNTTFSVKSNIEGEQQTFRVLTADNITYVYGDNIVIDINDTSENTYNGYNDIYLMGNNSVINLVNATEDTDITVQGDNNTVNPLTYGETTNITIKGDNNTVQSNENIILKGLPINVTGSNTKIGSDSYALSDNSNYKLKREYKVTSEPKTINLGENLTYSIKSANNSEQIFQIISDSNNRDAYIYGDNLNIEINDERTTSYDSSATYLFGNYSEINISKSANNTDIIIQGDNNIVNPNNTNSNTSVSVTGDNNEVTSNENIIESGISVIVTGSENKIGNQTFTVSNSSYYKLNADSTTQTGGFLPIEDSNSNSNTGGTGSTDNTEQTGGAGSTTGTTEGTDNSGGTQQTGETGNTGSTGSTGGTEQTGGTGLYSGETTTYNLQGEEEQTITLMGTTYKVKSKDGNPVTFSVTDTILPKIEGDNIILDITATSSAFPQIACNNSDINIYDNCSYGANFTFETCDNSNINVKSSEYKTYLSLLPEGQNITIDKSDTVPAENISFSSILGFNGTITWLTQTYTITQTPTPITIDDITYNISSKNNSAQTIKVTPALDSSGLTSISGTDLVIDIDNQNNNGNDILSLYLLGTKLYVNNSDITVKNSNGSMSLTVNGENNTIDKDNSIPASKISVNTDITKNSIPYATYTATTGIPVEITLSDFDYTQNTLATTNNLSLSIKSADDMEEFVVLNNTIYGNNLIVDINEEGNVPDGSTVYNYFNFAGSDSVLNICNIQNSVQISNRGNNNTFNNPGNINKDKIFIMNMDATNPNINFDYYYEVAPNETKTVELNGVTYKISSTDNNSHSFKIYTDDILDSRFFYIQGDNINVEIDESNSDDNLTSSAYCLNGNNSTLKLDKIKGSASIIIYGNNNIIDKSDEEGAIGGSIYVTSYASNTEGNTTTWGDTYYNPSAVTITPNQPVIIPQIQVLNYGEETSFVLTKDQTRKINVGGNIYTITSNSDTAQTVTVHNNTSYYDPTGICNITGENLTIDIERYDYYDRYSDVNFTGNNSLINISKADANININLYGNNNTIDKADSIPESMITYSGTNTTVIYNQYTISGDEEKTLSYDGLDFRIKSKDGSPCTFSASIYGVIEGDNIIVEVDNSKTYSGTISLSGNNSKIYVSSDTSSNGTYINVTGNNNIIDKADGVNADKLYIVDSGTNTSIPYATFTSLPNQKQTVVSQGVTYEVSSADDTSHEFVVVNNKILGSNLNIEVKDNEINTYSRPTLIFSGDNNHIQIKESIFYTPVEIIGSNNIFDADNSVDLSNINVKKLGTNTTIPYSMFSIPATGTENIVIGNLTFAVSSLDGNAHDIIIFQGKITGDNIKIELSSTGTAEKDLILNGSNSIIKVINNESNSWIYIKNSGENNTIDADTDTVDTSCIYIADTHLDTKFPYATKTATDEPQQIEIDGYTTYTITSKDGEPHDFAVVNSSFGKMIYGENLIVNISETKESSGYVHYYANLFNCNNSEINFVSKGDNGYSNQWVIYGNNNIFNKSETISADVITISDFGENNKIAYRHFTISGEETKTLNIGDVTYNIKSVDGQEHSFRIAENIDSTDKIRRENIIIGSGLDIEVVDNLDSYSKTVIKGDNSNINISHVSEAANILVMGDNNTITKAEEVSADNIIIYNLGNSNAIPEGIYTINSTNKTENSDLYSSYTNYNLDCGSTLTFNNTNNTINSETQSTTCQITSTPKTIILNGVKYNIKSVDGKSHNINIMNTSYNSYISGSNLDIEIDDEFGLIDNDLFHIVNISGDNNSITPINFKYLGHIEILGNQNTISSSENVNTEDLQIILHGNNNKIDDTLYDKDNHVAQDIEDNPVIPDTPTYINRTFTTTTQGETIEVTDAQGHSITYIIKSNGEDEQACKIIQNASGVYIYGDNITINIVDESTAAKTRSNSYSTNIFGKNTIININQSSNSTNIYVQGDNNTINPANVTASASVSINGDNCTVTSNENIPPSGLSLNVTGNNNTIGDEIEPFSLNSAYSLNPQFTISSADTEKEITLKDSQEKEVTYTIKTNSEEEQTFEIKQDGNRAYIYGNNIIVTVKDERNYEEGEEQTYYNVPASETYLYGENNVINLLQSGNNTDIIVQGDNNTVNPTNSNSAVNITVKGDNNRVTNSKDKLDTVAISATGNNNTVGVTTYPYSLNRNINLLSEWTISGNEPRTITVTNDSGKNITYTITSNDGTDKTFKFGDSGNTTTINGDGITVHYNDNAVQDSSYTNSPNLNFNGNGSNLYIDKQGSKRANINIFGNDNYMKVNTQFINGAFSVTGDNNTLDAGDDMIYGEQVTIKGNNNSLNGLLTVSSSFGTTKYLCSDYYFLYNNNVPITAENFVKIFDKNGDNQVTKEDLAEFRFDNYDLNNDDKINRTDADFMRKIAKIMVTGTLTDGTKVAEPLFDITDSEFTTPKKLAELQHNIENNIDVTNSKAAINAIIASGKVTINNTPISNINELDSAAQIFSQSLSNNNELTEIFLSKDSTLSSAIEEFISLLTDYVTENQDNLDLNNYGRPVSVKAYLDNVTYGLRDFYGYGNPMRTQSLQTIADSTNLPAQLRQAAANIITLDLQAKELSPQLKALENADKIASDKSTIAYNKVKETYKMNTLSEEIEELEAKETLTDDEQDQLDALHSQYEIAEATYEALYENDVTKWLELQDKLPPLTTNQQHWAATQVHENYLEVKDEEDISVNSLSGNITSRKLTSASFAKRNAAQPILNSNNNVINLVIFYSTDDIIKGDLNDSNLLSVLAQLTTDQKTNAVTLNTKEGTITVHLPGELDGKIPTPRTYKISDLEKLTNIAVTEECTLENGSKATQTTMKALTQNNLLAKAIEVATIDNFGANIFDTEMSIAEAWKYLTGQLYESKYSLTYVNWNRAVEFSTIDGEKYAILSYDEDNNTLTYYSLSEPDIILSKSIDEFKNMISLVSQLNNDKEYYAVSAEANEIIQNTDMCSKYVASDIFVNIADHYATAEDFTNDIDNLHISFVEIKNDLSQTIEDFFKLNTLTNEAEIKTALKTKLDEVVEKYKDTNLYEMAKSLAQVAYLTYGISSSSLTEEEKNNSENIPVIRWIQSGDITLQNDFSTDEYIDNFMTNEEKETISSLYLFDYQTIINTMNEQHIGFNGAINELWNSEYNTDAPAYIEPTVVSSTVINNLNDNFIKTIRDWNDSFQSNAANSNATSNDAVTSLNNVLNIFSDNYSDTAYGGITQGLIDLAKKAFSSIFSENELSTTDKNILGNLSDTYSETFNNGSQSTSTFDGWSDTFAGMLDNAISSLGEMGNSFIDMIKEGLSGNDNTINSQDYAERYAQEAMKDLNPNSEYTEFAEAIENYIKDPLNSLQEKINNIKEYSTKIKNIGPAISEAIGNAWEKIKETASEIINIPKNIWDKIKERWKGLPFGKKGEHGEDPNSPDGANGGGKYSPPDYWASPLSFDINNDDIKTKEEIIDFDIDGDGTLDKINDSAEFVLAFDSDNNGISGENGRELFGNATDINNDGISDGYKNGFEALKALAIKYNLIGENDTVLNTEDLKFLQDKVGLRMKNGYLGEAYTFEELGITAINLPKTTETTLQNNFDGRENNLMTQNGATFVVDGKEQTYADIWHKIRE